MTKWRDFDCAYGKSCIEKDAGFLRVLSRIFGTGKRLPISPRSFAAAREAKFARRGIDRFKELAPKFEPNMKLKGDEFLKAVDDFSSRYAIPQYEKTVSAISGSLARLSQVHKNSPYSVQREVGERFGQRMAKQNPLEILSRVDDFKGGPVYSGFSSSDGWKSYYPEGRLSPGAHDDEVGELLFRMFNSHPFRRLHTYR